jgi:hypothetical protein
MMSMQLVCTCTLPFDRKCMWLTNYIRYFYCYYHYTLFLLRGKVHLQISCSKGCQNPTPCWTRQIQARPNQPWARCSVFIPLPASPGPNYIRYSGEECAHLPVAREASEEANIVAHDAQPLSHRRVLKAAHKVLRLLLATPKPAAQTQHISCIHLLQSLLLLTFCRSHSTTCIPSGLFLLPGNENLSKSLSEPHACSKRAKGPEMLLAVFSSPWKGTVKGGGNNVRLGRRGHNILHQEPLTTAAIQRQNKGGLCKQGGRAHPKSDTIWPSVCHCGLNTSMSRCPPRSASISRRASNDSAVGSTAAARESLCHAPTQSLSSSHLASSRPCMDTDPFGVCLLPYRPL